MTGSIVSQKPATVTPDAVASPAEDALNAAVQRSFALGWHVAELCYPENPEEGAVGLRLPQLAGLGSRPRRQLLVAQISADLDALALERHGLVVPLHATAPGEDRTADPLSRLPEITLPPLSPDELAAMHSAIMLRLTVKHYDLGKGYSLGVGLAQTVLEAYHRVRPDGQDPLGSDAAKSEIARVFDRDTVIELWSQIKDLKSRLPPYSADPVAATLWDWCRWAADNTPAAGKSPQVTGSETIPDRLRRQGQIWRALLGGERKPTDVLLIGNYVDAAADILRKYWTLTSQVLAKSWPTAVFSVLVIALAVAVFFVVERFVGNTAAALGAALGALGISWATIVAAVKGALNEVEKALWQTEITAAIGLAISHVPELPANSAVMGLRKDDPGLSGPAVEPVIKRGPDLSGRLRRAMSRTMSPQAQPNSRS